MSALNHILVSSYQTASRVVTERPITLSTEVIRTAPIGKPDIEVGISQRKSETVLNLVGVRDPAIH